LFELIGVKFAKEFEIIQKIEKEKEKEIKKRKKAAGNLFSLVVEPAHGPPGLLPKGYAASPFSHR
jgi:hypothetical protein